VSLLLAAIVLLPALGAITAVALGDRHVGVVAKAGPLAGGLAFLLAVVVMIDVALRGSLSAVISTGAGRVLLGLYANRITGVLLLLVSGVGTLVQAFAGGYLRGDMRVRRFYALTSILTAATLAMVSAATLIGLGVAWTIAGLSLWLLLGIYPGLPAARQGTRRSAIAFAIGDSALWAAIALALLNWGDLDLRHLGEQARSLTGNPTLVAVFSCLVLVAALSRSAQIPFQRWLPATLAAPTPVSALLHAGVINAGGILLVRLSGLFGTSQLACTLAFCLGGATLVYGTVLMLAKPDIKGALAHSTMGQMGFMIMTCGLGAFASAVFHLVAHGMYKASMFLGSGAAVHRHVRHTKAPPRPAASPAAAALTALFAGVFGGASVLSAAAALHPHVGGRGGSGALLVFAWATAAALTWGIVRRRLRFNLQAVMLAGIFTAAWIYVAWLSAFTRFLSVDLSTVQQSPASPWLLAPLLAVLALLAIMRLAGAPKRLRAIHDSLYVFALTAGHVAQPRLPRQGREPGSAVVARRALEVGFEAVS
jgi:NAD(P)H-quinone oxidoreductase subunit 5